VRLPSYGRRGLLANALLLAPSAAGFRFDRVQVLEATRAASETLTPEEPQVLDIPRL